MGTLKSACARQSPKGDCAVNNKLVLSPHAWERAESENLTEAEIAFAAEIGFRERRTGIIFCQVRKRELARLAVGNQDCWRLAGTTVLLCSCGQFVITVYRNPSAFKKDRRKQKYNHSKGFHCPCCGHSSSHAA